MTDAATTHAAIPMSSYEDSGTAVDWLCDAFGLRETDEPYGRLYNATGVEEHGSMFMANHHH